ncbi:MAG: retroviral-like aspartic protease family protein [Candidatus Krumholzibacteria bacterium]|nr:retroviral-like aspartic protease family protein [Candidatus Krumholzibacteria bacterium]
MNLETFLLQDGYRRVPLSRNPAGHFQTEGAVNGRPVTVIVDTGAGATIVSLTLATELGLGMERQETRGGGAGGVTLDVYATTGGTLTLGDVAPRVRTLMAMDLSHVNEGLACKGCAPIDAILGADVFDAQSAVIDYGSSSLYLKE